MLVVYQMDANAKLRFAELKDAKALVAKVMEKQNAKRTGKQSRPKKTPPTEDKKKR